MGAWHGSGVWREREDDEDDEEEGVYPSIYESVNGRLERIDGHIRYGWTGPD